MLKRLSTFALVSSLTIVGYAHAHDHVNADASTSINGHDLASLDVVFTDSAKPSQGHHN